MAQSKPNKEFRIRLTSEKHKVRLIELAKMKGCTVTEIVRCYIIDGLSKEPALTDYKPKQQS